MQKELEFLLELQHIEYMIKDWKDKEKREQFEKMGFKTKDNEPLKLLLQEKEKIVKKFPPKLYNRYKLLMDHYHDWAVVPVVNGFCGGCFEKVPTQLSAHPDKVMECPNCGRFIYWR